MQPSYTYSASVIRWVDGDTVDLRVDVGFYIFHESRFRLLGINTPERGEEGWAEATLYAGSLAPQGSPVVIRTTKADKYGRFLADVYANGVSVNTALLEAKLAQPYNP